MDHKNSIDIFMLRRRVRGIKVAAVPTALIEERRVAAASVVGQITTANTAAAGAPPFTLELFVVAAMGFFPETEVGVARQAFNQTIGYLYQVCDRMFLGEASHTLLHMHVRVEAALGLGLSVDQTALASAPLPMDLAPGHKLAWTCQTKRRYPHRWWHCVNS